MPEKRIPVPLTPAERAELEAAAKRSGIRNLSDYLRMAGLFVARMQEGKP